VQQIVWQEACLSAAASGPPCRGPQSGRSVKRSRVETPEKVRAEQDPETRSHIHVLSSTLIPKRSSWGGATDPLTPDADYSTGRDSGDSKSPGKFATGPPAAGVAGRIAPDLGA